VGAAEVISEREIQREAVGLLRRAGYRVIVTSTNRSSRVTTGCPDLFVRVPLSRAVWLGLEIKAPKGALTVEQRAEEACGDIIICRSVDDVINAIKNHKET
jgi:hypothetical protein